MKNKEDIALLSKITAGIVIVLFCVAFYEMGKGDSKKNVSRAHKD